MQKSVYTALVPLYTKPSPKLHIIIWAARWKTRMPQLPSTEAMTTLMLGFIQYNLRQYYKWTLIKVWSYGFPTARRFDHTAQPCPMCFEGSDELEHLAVCRGHQYITNKLSGYELANKNDGLGISSNLALQLAVACSWTVISRVQNRNGNRITSSE